MKAKLAAVLQIMYANLVVTDDDKETMKSRDEHREEIFQFGDGMGLTSMTGLPGVRLSSDDSCIVELQEMKVHSVSA